MAVLGAPPRDTWFHGTRHTFDTPAPDEPSPSISRAPPSAPPNMPAGRAACLAPAHSVCLKRISLSPTPSIRTAWTLEAVLHAMDWDESSRQMQAFAQSPDWPLHTLRKWAHEGAWQVYELPAVLACLRGRYDALFLEELGDWGVAMFEPAQVSIIATPAALPDATDQHRPRHQP